MPSDPPSRGVLALVEEYRDRFRSGGIEMNLWDPLASDPKKPPLRKFPISADNLERLLQGGWLDDEVVNAYGALLLQRLRNLQPSQKQYVASTFAFVNEKQRIKDLNNLLSKPSLPPDHRNVTSTMPKSAASRINTFDRLFFPINYGRSHWVLAEVYPALRLVLVFDSLPYNNHTQYDDDEHEEDGDEDSDALDRASVSLEECIVTHMRYWLVLTAHTNSSSGVDAVAERTAPWTFHQASVARQMNNDDCGVFALKTLEHRLLQPGVQSLHQPDLAVPTPPLTPQQATHVARLHIELELYTQKMASLHFLVEDARTKQHKSVVSRSKDAARVVQIDQHDLVPSLCTRIAEATDAQLPVVVVLHREQLQSTYWEMLFKMAGDLAFVLDVPKGATLTTSLRKAMARVNAQRPPSASAPFTLYLLFANTFSLADVKREKLDLAAQSAALTYFSFAKPDEPLFSQSQSQSETDHDSD